jgi:hypothetical protein
LAGAVGAGGNGAAGAGGSSTDGQAAMDASDGGEAGPPADPATQLNGFLFDVACPDPNAVGQCDVPAASRMKMKTLQFGGDPKVTYNVKLHFCGPVEARPYTGCTATQSTYVCVDGTARTDGYNATYPTYEIRVPAPAHSYFLNNLDLKDDLMKIDYSATLAIKGGSTIIFATDGGSNTTIFTSTIKSHNFTCPGVPGIQQPFAGQFVYMTVDSVTPVP